MVVNGPDKDHDKRQQARLAAIKAKIKKKYPELTTGSTGWYKAYFKYLGQ